LPDSLKDFYRTLGVPDNAHEQDIKLAYRRLAKQYHPDLNQGDKKSEERFKEIVEAYNTLSDPILKSAYDRKKSGRDFFTRADFFYTDQPKEKKDPRRKEYSQEDLDRAREINRRKTLANMARRKKILIGMIITFVLYLVGSGFFETWIEKKRKEETDSLAIQLDRKYKTEMKKQNLTIDNVDSPFDSLFGPGVYVSLSPNNLVIFNHFSDAVICAVDVHAPHKTIRNEFTHPAIEPLILRDLPNGSYYIKIYSGSNWDVSKRVPDGRVLGGFSKNEAFFRIHYGPFTLTKPTHDHPVTHVADTIWIDPKVMKMDSISRGEFFSAGDK
jgi:curved DNA-binding protein CbpA